MGKIISRPVNCKTAAGFLEKLSPNGNYFGSAGIFHTWMFRGQAKDWPLVPSLYRDEKVKEFSRRPLNNHGERCLAERDILCDFFEIADKRGFELPDDSQELRKKLSIFKSERGDKNVAELSHWRLSDEMLPLTALAQHYGLPTALLDWSRQATTAAYFAGEGAERARVDGKVNPGDVMVVWAFNCPNMLKQDSIDVNFPVSIVTAPTATNHNLRAQQGVFTRLIPSLSKEESGVYTPMELALEQYSSHKNTDHSGLEMAKFTLPTSESEELLSLLAKLDVMPSSIYPGLASVVTDMRWKNKYQW